MADRQKMIMTHSRAQMFKSCPRKEFYRYECGIVPRRTSIPLEVGKLWHSCMADIYSHMQQLQSNNQTPHLDDDLYNDILDRMDAIINDWTKANLDAIEKVENMLIDLDDTAPIPNFTRSELEESSNLVKGLLPHYLEMWWDHDIDKYQILEIEPRFTFAVHTSRGNPSTKWKYAGGIDLVMVEKVSGRLIILDHKTTSMRADIAATSMQIPGQNEGYLWLYAMNNGYAPEGGIIYRMSRKKLPAQPSFNKCPKRPKDGDHSNCEMCKGTEMGPLSASSCDTLPWIYREALQQAESRGFPRTAKHEDVLANLESRGFTPWFAANERSVSPYLIGVWHDDLYSITLAKNHALRRGEGGHFKANSDACMKFGRECPYRVLCENGLGAKERLEKSAELQEVFEFKDPHEELRQQANETSEDNEG